MSTETTLVFETVHMPFIAEGGEFNTSLAVMGEHVAPGLAIVPMIGADEDRKVFFLGGFSLVHTSDGKHLGTDQIITCLGCVTRFAEAMVATGIDWTQTHGQIAELVKGSPELSSALGEASIQLLGCAESECETSHALGEPEEARA